MINRKKFEQIRKDIIADRGQLSLFALFLLEGAEDQWDLVVAAPWLDADQTAALRYLSKKLTTRLSKRELLEIARIVLIKQNDPSLKKLLRDTIVEGGEVREIENSQFAGLALRRALILEAKPARATATRRAS